MTPNNEKILSLGVLKYFYDTIIYDRFIHHYKELVNDAKEGSLAIIANSEVKYINDYLEFNPDSIALTEFNLPDEVDDSRLSPLLNKILNFFPTGYTSLNQIGDTPKGFALSLAREGENVILSVMIPELGGYPIYLYVNADPDTLNSLNITTNGVQTQAVNELNQYISSVGNLKFYGLTYGDIGDDFWFTDVEITPEEIDSINYLLLNNSTPTDLYIRRNNTWQNITGDIDWLKNPNNIDPNQIKFEMDSRIKDFVESQGIEYELAGVNPNTVAGIINYNAYVSAVALTEAREAIQRLNNYKVKDGILIL